ncbi:MAG: Sugar phosphate isomerase/epimerase [Candidatus Hydrogenedentes bacterium]|nr:Sugar phosphate isomerase/epimerase [Candidatus Hydrogenedentota bacterium]
MKTGINQWAFPGAMPAAEAISLAKRIGFESFEVCIADDGPVRMDASEADMAALRRHADKEGIALTSVATSMGGRAPLSSPDPAVRTRGKEIFARLIEMTRWLGLDILLTVPGGVNPEMQYDVALENALASVQDLIPVAEKHRVCMAIENVWNKFLLSPVEMRDFIDQCESDCVGAYFDIGNILQYGYPEQWIRILGRRIRMVHAKDFRMGAGNIHGFVMLMEGDVNWPEVMAAFREVGYDDALVAEYGPYGHSFEVVLKHALASLQTIVTL